MQAKDLKIGGHYLAKVSGKLTTVRIDSIRENRWNRSITYAVTNLATGRQVSFHSCRKFRQSALTGNSSDPQQWDTTMATKTTKAASKKSDKAPSKWELDESTKRSAGTDDAREEFKTKIAAIKADENLPADIKTTVISTLTAKLEAMKAFSLTVAVGQGDDIKDLISVDPGDGSRGKWLSPGMLRAIAANAEFVVEYLDAYDNGTI